jgi:hypothetical protein
MLGAPFEERAVLHPNLPRREPGVPRRGEDVEKSTVLNRLRAGEGTGHP